MISVIDTGSMIDRCPIAGRDQKKLTGSAIDKCHAISRHHWKKRQDPQLTDVKQLVDTIGKRK